MSVFSLTISILSPFELKVLWYGRRRDRAVLTLAGILLLDDVCTVSKGLLVSKFEGDDAIVVSVFALKAFKHPSEYLRQQLYSKISIDSVVSGCGSLRDNCNNFTASM